MPLIEFCGQSASDPDNGQANTSRLINCYRESTGAGRSPRVIKSVLGTTGFAALEGVFLRAMKQIRGFVYVVHAGRLKRLSQTGQVLDLAAIDDDTNTFMSSHEGQVTIAANGRYYLWNGTAISNPTVGPFTGDVADVTFMNNRTVLIEKGQGRKIAWSEVGDPADIRGDNFTTAAQDDDECLRVFQVGGALMVMKERSIEFFGNTATGFTYVPGKRVERGLKAPGLAVKVPDGVFYVGDDGLAYIATSSGISRPMSADCRAVETALKEGKPTHCFYHEDESSKHLVVRFSDRPAWVCDFSTAEWHERADKVNDAWSVFTTERAFGGYLAGRETGEIYRLERVSADVDGPLVRTMVSRSLYFDAQRFSLPLITFRGRMGRSFLGRSTATVLSTTGLVLADGSGAALLVSTNDESPRDAKVMISVSKDYGETWGAPRVYSMGDQGDYSKRIRTRSWGRFEDSATFRISISDPAELTFDASAVPVVA